MACPKVPLRPPPISVPSKADFHSPEIVMRLTKPFFLTVAAYAVLCFAVPGALASTISAKFAAIDGNHDGVISPGEHEDYVRKTFDLVDTNHDHKISTAELDAAQDKVFGTPHRHPEINTAQKIRHFDVNGDGEVSETEMGNGGRQLFLVMDYNRNGKVTPQEFAAGW
jgi:Ca2+-binding EF-hand superfamily protein